MKNEIKKLGMHLLLILLITSISAFVLTFAEKVNSENFFDPKASVTHAPIFIVGDNAMDAFFLGDGTDGLSWANAHVIEGYEIDAGDTGSPIEIWNTTRYLKIMNCVLTNGDKDTGFYGGIALLNCSNIRITDCETSQSFMGIYGENCENIIVSDNILTNNTYDGVLFYNSNDTVIFNNDITLNGMHAIVFYNDEFGMNHTISNNNLEANGIAVSPPEDPASIWLHATKNSTISNNQILDNVLYGIYLDEGSNDNRIYLNEISDGNYDGIYLESCSSNIINNNTIRRFAEYGVRVTFQSEFNEICYNRICDCELGMIRDTSLHPSSNNKHDNTDVCPTPETPESNDDIPRYLLIPVFGAILCSVILIVHKDRRKIQNTN